MKEIINLYNTCPICGKQYTGHPALSRLDNSTLICSDCGTRQALESIGVSEQEQNEIINITDNNDRSQFATFRLCAVFT